MRGVPRALGGPAGRRCRALGGSTRVDARGARDREGGRSAFEPRHVISRRLRSFEIRSPPIARFLAATQPVRAAVTIRERRRLWRGGARALAPVGDDAAPQRQSSGRGSGGGDSGSGSTGGGGAPVRVRVIAAQREREREEGGARVKPDGRSVPPPPAAAVAAAAAATAIVVVVVAGSVFARRNRGSGGTGVGVGGSHSPWRPPRPRRRLRRAPARR